MNFFDWLSGATAVTPGEDRLTFVTRDMFVKAIGETLQMVGVALVFGTILGIAIGATLALTRRGGILRQPVVYGVLSVVVNLIRSLPFIILLVAILPFTRLVVGTGIGTWAAIVPLTVMVAPYIGRLIENSLLEVPAGLIEAARAMGASPWQILVRVLIPEARGSLVLAITIATIGLTDATAMAGTVGGGGLGTIALDYGWQRYDAFAMLVTVIALIVLVQLIQLLGTRISRRFRRR
ncbi:methionine ABC transporter permease [Galbitalea sp. SE-J8]|uniref:methionine ABC transporter permease n=1 Tax=Galbitalea sp. SE-J8 TaxID=3054952 RepID=UPI00259C9E7B|nr:methionine ABC transporter permease [Galbitalea sp. SE-J8]MDM4763696.1 methionine ABC transporter permease [Galbitalea sp. SE-J8]